MELPLFPLPNLVAFPGVLIPLHIFEPRYRLMINRSIDRDEPFGLLLLRDEAPEESPETIHRVGTVLRVVQVERLDDGRMNISCRVETRFQVLRFAANDPYWLGEVETFEDLPDVMPDDPRVLRAADQFRKALHVGRELSGEPSSDFDLPQDPSELSFAVSYALDIPAEEKQGLLELRSVSDRLDQILPHLDATLQRFELQRSRQAVILKTRRNGDLGHPGQ